MAGPGAILLLSLATGTSVSPAPSRAGSGAKGIVRGIATGVLGFGSANCVARSGVKLLDFRANEWHLY